MKEIYVSLPPLLHERSSTTRFPGFSSLQAAIDSLENTEEEILIHLSPGIYRERIALTRSHVTILGEGTDPADTVITAAASAWEMLPEGRKRGTFRTQTFFLHASNVKLENLTIENTAGPGKEAGQCIALCADGDRLVFDHVRLIGHQDTLFTGPLPEKEILPGGFTGPLESEPRVNGRHYYHACEIQGNVDFIFGSATAFFEDCTIRCVLPCREGEEESFLKEYEKAPHPLGYVTAASTPEGQEYGYVFYHCRVIGDGRARGFYLGRPWREYAKVVFLHCELGPQIVEAGWDDWQKPGIGTTAFFAEYQSQGEGTSPDRAAFSRQLSDEEAEHFTKELVLGE